MTSAITATRLRKSFGGTAVLDGMDLEVTPGRSGLRASPCSGPIAISAPGYAAAGNEPSSASPAAPLGWK